MLLQKQVFVNILKKSFEDHFDRNSNTDIQNFGFPHPPMWSCLGMSK